MKKEKYYLKNYQNNIGKRILNRREKKKSQGLINLDVIKL